MSDIACRTALLRRLAASERDIGVEFAHSRLTLDLIHEITRGFILETKTSGAE